MPTYQFSCLTCGAVKETFFRMSEIGSAHVKCDHCQKKMVHDITPQTGYVKNRTLGTIADQNDHKLSADHKLAILKQQYSHGKTINEKGDKGQIPSDILRGAGLANPD